MKNLKDLQSILKTGHKLILKNAPTILTTTAITGLFGSVILANRAGAKSAREIDAAEKDLIELQEELKKYIGWIVEDKEIVSKQTKLIDFHIGAVDSFIVGYNPLCINYHTEAHSYITNQFTELKVELDKNKIVCDGGNIKYEYNFL